MHNEYGVAQEVIMQEQTVTVSFRLLNLDMMQAYTLKKEIQGATFYKLNDAEIFVGIVPLKEQIFDEINDFVIRQQIQYNECDIYVEGPLCKANTSISVPRVVNKMLKYIDCKLTYGVANYSH